MLLISLLQDPVVLAPVRLQNHRGRIAILRQKQIHQETRRTSIAIDKWTRRRPPLKQVRPP
jgi:hypothetical protein